MSKDYFNTLPSGYIEYVDKIMSNLVVGAYAAPEWDDSWDIRLDDLKGNPIWAINGYNSQPIYRINYNPSAFLFNMVPMGGEGNKSNSSFKYMISTTLKDSYMTSSKGRIWI